MCQGQGQNPVLNDCDLWDLKCTTLKENGNHCLVSETLLEMNVSECNLSPHPQMQHKVAVHSPHSRLFFFTCCHLLSLLSPLNSVEFVTLSTDTGMYPQQC